MHLKLLSFQSLWSFRLLAILIVGCYPLLLNACSPVVLDTLDLMYEARALSAQAVPYWENNVIGFDAILRPQSGPLRDSSLVLTASYRASNSSEENAKFVLFLPQGTSVGQCERKGENVSCSNASFPGASSLVWTSFAALDEIFLLRPSGSERYALFRGDSRSGIGEDHLVLKRQSVEGKMEKTVVFSVQGAILAAYASPARGQSPMDDTTTVLSNAERRLQPWAASFTNGPKEYLFRFLKQQSSVQVSITRLVEKP